MWPVNYDDIHKFHLSAGIGLLVAAALLFYGTWDTSYDRLQVINTGILTPNNPYNTTVYGNETLGKIMIEATTSHLNNIVFVSHILFFFGFPEKDKSRRQFSFGSDF